MCVAYIIILNHKRSLSFFFGMYGNIAQNWAVFFCLLVCIDFGWKLMTSESHICIVKLIQLVMKPIFTTITTGVVNDDDDNDSGVCV